MKYLNIYNKDAWCFDIDFFIKAAFFALKQKNCSVIKEPISFPEGRHNYTDGELHYTVKCLKLISTKYQKGRKILSKYKVYKFELRANVYSYQSVFNDALIKIAKSNGNEEIINEKSTNTDN